MNLSATQAYKLLAEHGVFALEICDRCRKVLGSVRYTRRGESGVWCSRECRGDGEWTAIRKGGRPRKHESDADKQRAYRHRVLGVTKPSDSLAETKDLQRQKQALSHTPLPGPESAVSA